MAVPYPDAVRVRLFRGAVHTRLIAARAGTGLLPRALSIPVVVCQKARLRLTTPAAFIPQKTSPAIIIRIWVVASSVIAAIIAGPRPGAVVPGIAVILAALKLVGFSSFVHRAAAVVVVAVSLLNTTSVPDTTAVVVLATRLSVRRITASGTFSARAEEPAACVQGRGRRGPRQAGQE